MSETDVIYRGILKSIQDGELEHAHPILVKSWPYFDITQRKVVLYSLTKEWSTAYINGDNDYMEKIAYRAIRGVFAAENESISTNQDETYGVNRVLIEGFNFGVPEDEV